MTERQDRETERRSESDRETETQRETQTQTHEEGEGKEGREGGREEETRKGEARETGAHVAERKNRVEEETTAKIMNNSPDGKTFAFKRKERKMPRMHALCVSLKG